MDADVFEMKVNSVLKNIFQKEKEKREGERKVCSVDKQWREIREVGKSASFPLFSANIKQSPNSFKNRRSHLIIFQRTDGTS